MHLRDREHAAGHEALHVLAVALPPVDVGALVVCGEGGVIGILTDRDIVAGPGRMLLGSVAERVVRAAPRMPSLTR